MADNDGHILISMIKVEFVEDKDIDPGEFPQKQGPQPTRVVDVDNFLGQYKGHYSIRLQQHRCLKKE